jgi:hypothetical protein
LKSHNSFGARNPIVWSAEDFERDRLTAIEQFRRERLQEPLESYLAVFDEMQGVWEKLLLSTSDLTQIEAVAEILPSEPALRSSALPGRSANLT